MNLSHKKNLRSLLTSNQQPATSNQQPATSNQQPATSNQQPATNLPLPTNISMPLIQAVVMDLNEGIEQLQSAIVATSPLKMELYMLAGQHAQNESDIRQGIIDLDDRDLRQNRIRKGLLELIQKLELADLDGGYNETIQKAKDSIEQNQTVTSAAAPSTPTQPAVTTPAELDFFVEMNASTIKAFPRVYRSMRSIIFRNNQNGTEAKDAYLKVFPHLDALKDYAALLHRMRPIKLWQKTDDRTYELRLRTFKDAASVVEMDDLTPVVEKLSGFQALVQEFEAKGLL